MVRHLNGLWLVALFVAWSFDQLFWQKPPGVSFALFAAISLAGGFWLARREGRHPARRSLWLLLPIALFAGFSLARLEPFTQTLNIALALGCMALLANTFLGGRWLNYGLADFFRLGFSLGASMISLPILAGEQHRKEAAASGQQAPRQPTAWRRALPWVRGAALALPVVLLFTMLLASADPIFSQGVEDFFAWFKIDRLPELLFRAIYILILSHALAGVYLHLLNASRDENLLGLEKPILPRFLGFIEASVVLGSVNALFAAFVAVQFRYFFGGQANIHLQGYTYADYARRGFGELVAVALFSLLLFLGLSALARREGRAQARIFSLLGIALALLVCVMLVSAFQRLTLYEEVYGFTRLRTYTHVFMAWLGLLLLALIVLEAAGRLRAFAPAALLAALGFGLTLNVLNVDAFIARQNLARAQRGEVFDPAYLDTLSPDATPELARLFSNGSLGGALTDQLGGVLACQRQQLALDDNLSWPSFHISRAVAKATFDGLQDELEAYPTSLDERGSWQVTVGGQTRLCAQWYWD